MDAHVGLQHYVPGALRKITKERQPWLSLPSIRQKKIGAVRAT